MSNKEKTTKPQTTKLSTVVLVLLKAHRQEARIRQADVATRIGYTASAWSKIENGYSPLTLDVLDVIVASVLGMQLSEFLADVEKASRYLSTQGWVVHSAANIDMVDDLLALHRATAEVFLVKVVDGTLPSTMLPDVGLFMRAKMAAKKGPM